MGVVAVYTVLALCLGIYASEGVVTFYLEGSNNETYKHFIREVRAELAAGGTVSHGIPVLRANGSVPDSERFVLVDLINLDDTNVTVALDVVNAYVVAYRVDDRSYFFREENPERAIGTLFPGTRRHSLPYDVNYGHLERAAGINSLGDLSLGRGALQHAITRLRLHGTVAKSILVIAQMVSEAARFRAMEFAVAAAMIPGAGDMSAHRGLLGIQTEWRSLSEQVQYTRENETTFPRSVSVETRTTVSVVDSMRSKIVAGLALLLYATKQPPRSSTSHMISVTSRSNLPVSGVPAGNNIIVSGGHQGQRGMEGGQKTSNADRTTRIGGPGGLCAELQQFQSFPLACVVLAECNKEDRQEWAFHSDGTIRFAAADVCLAAGSDPRSIVTLAECDSDDSTKWKFSVDGTITSAASNLVLTGANRGFDRIYLMVEPNTYATTQAWTTLDPTEPSSRVASIVMHDHMCLEANGDKLWLVDCVLDKEAQEWRLYSDDTIRVNGHLSSCLTSGHCANDVIFIGECDGSATQRWAFQTDGTILNPGTKLVMVPKPSDPDDIKRIVLYRPSGDSDQEWVAILK